MPPTFSDLFERVLATSTRLGALQRPKLPLRLVRALDRGVGLSAASVLLFGASITSFGLAGLELMDSRRALAKWQKDAISVRHEPRADEQYPGRAAAILSVDEAEVRRATMDTLLGAGAFEALQKEVEAALTQPCDDIVATTMTLSEVRTYVLDEHEEDRVGFDVVKRAADPLRVIDGFAAGAATHLRLAGTSTVAGFIPSYLDASPANTHPAGAHPEYTSPAFRRETARRALCALRGSTATRLLTADREGVGGGAIQLYLVTLDGALAIRVREDGKSRLGLLWTSPWTSFASAAYIRHFLERPSWVNAHTGYTSPRFYEDRLAAGLTATTCAAVRRDGLFGGVLCADATPRPSELQGIVDGINNRNPSLSAKRYCADEGQVYADACTPARSPRAEPVQDEELARLVRHELQRRFERARAGVDENEADGTVGTLLARVDPNGSEVWVVSKRPFGQEVDSYALVGMGLLVCAMACLAGAVRKAAVLRERIAVSEILRNIQVGVVYVEDDVIVHGNDRAEEILGHPLPAFPGDPSVQPTVRFNRLIEDTVFSASPPSQGGGPGARPLQKLPYERIERLRGAGVPSRYFAIPFGRKRKDEAWLIYGSPVLGHGARRSRSFGVIDLYKPGDEQELAAGVSEELS